MKKIKIYLTVIIATLILSISTGVYAYGSQVDTQNAITMPTSLSNGTGTITTTITGSIKYQFVEITSEKYATIKKYEAIYNLISAYIDQDSNYDSMATNYEKTYNQTANGIIDEYGIQFNEEGLNAIKGLWISELTTYDASAWVNADGTTITLDLTTFEGTKYYIAWVQIGDTYDAEVYTVTGTKKEEPKEEPKEEQKDEPKNEVVEKENTIKKDTTTVSTKTLPKTGINSSILGLLVIAIVATGVSYIKYRKIK